MRFRSIITRRTSFMVLLAAAWCAAPLAAQDIFFTRRTGGYSGLGLSGGNFKLTCDSGCSGDQRSSTGAALLLGRHFGPRVRGEVVVQYQSNSETSSNAFTITGGAAVYLIGGLYVRGGVSYLRTSVEDTTGTFDGGGGPGFQVGAGYDLYLGRTFALTPYVNFTTGTISKLERTLGATTVTTSGSLRALQFGVAASFLRGTWTCVTASGQRIRVTRGNRVAATACLVELERRLGRRPGGIKL